MRRGIIYFTLFVLSFMQVSCSSENAPEQKTSQGKPLMVYLVRHAEKIDQSRDPELSVSGKERALVLASVLRSANIEYIHSSDYIRTRETAKPLAQELGLSTEIYNPKELETFAQQLRETGGVHLVVGHSNSTPSLVSLLGGESGTEINEAAEYDRLYIVSDSGNGFVSSSLIRYGRFFDESVETGTKAE